MSQKHANFEWVDGLKWQALAVLVVVAGFLFFLLH